MMAPVELGEDPFFSSSPFSNVADGSSARCWSGRPSTRESLRRLRRSLVRLTDSTLDVIWANLGAGKTHTLLHLAHLLQDEQGQLPASPRSVCAFVEMPEQVRHFLDLYRRIISALPLDRIAEFIAASPADVLPETLTRAARVLKYGSQGERRLVTEWLSGGRPLLKDLRTCSGITVRVEDDSRATDMLCSIVRALSHGRTRLVILVDEFQRIGVLRAEARNNLLSCVRSVFSRCPHHFSAVLSIQSVLEANALEFLPPELRTLLGRRPTISLPEMDCAEAKEFLVGRLRCFRPADYAGGETAPFEPSAVDAVLRFLHNDAGVALSPREILQAFSYVYAQAEDPSTGIATDEALRLLGSA